MNERRRTPTMAKRILTPIDGREPSETIVPVVAALARGAGSTVRLLRVFPVPEHESNGKIDLVTDDEIVEAYRMVAALEGIFCEPASAASVAGVIKTQKAGLFKDGDSAVCTLTGHGLKDVDIAISVSQKPATIQANMEDVVRVLGY